MILAFDTSSAACTAALFNAHGECVSRADEVIGRGHSERLVPMLAELLDGQRAEHVIVGVGPGSFTGIRVAIAAAHGLAIGWRATVDGMSSLGLLAAGSSATGRVGVAISGGHGELFIQEFNQDLEPLTGIRNLRPEDASSALTAELVVGSGAAQIIDARGWGEARDALPAAADTLTLPEQLRSLAAKPVYARAPDARVRSAAA